MENNEEYEEAFEDYSFCPCCGHGDCDGRFDSGDCKEEA